MDSYNMYHQSLSWPNIGKKPYSLSIYSCTILFILTGRSWHQAFSLDSGLNTECSCKNGPISAQNWQKITFVGNIFSKESCLKTNCQLTFWNYYYSK